MNLRVRAREMAEAAWRNDYQRNVEPVGADDGAEKVKRLEAALLLCVNPNHRSLIMRELGRLQWLEELHK